MMKTCCILDFSSRPYGNTHRISDFIKNAYQGRYEVQQFAFSKMQIHGCGTCDYECFQNRSSCPHRADDATAMYQAIMKSELTLYIIPNYCDFPCANFFLYNERSQCAFADYEKDYQTWLHIPKKFIVISNTNTDNFRSILQYHTDGDPAILYLRSRDVPCKSLDGNLIDYDVIQHKILAFLEQE